MTAPLGWDDVDTARAYERFCRRHGRYRVANEALVAHAALEPGQHVLDVGAGTGRTAAAVLPFIGTAGAVVCVEPARAMREAGQRRVDDPRVTWTDILPAAGSFDRVVCGAAIWQLVPLDATVARLASLIAPGGALAFNIPALYLLEPDRPGGGRDPMLVQLPTLVERSAVPPPSASASACGASDIEQILIGAELDIERWSFDLRLTQAAYRDWLKIPPVSEGLLAGLAPAERARRLDDAYTRADRRSWRWERWIGWTAWRR